MSARSGLRITPRSELGDIVFVELPEVGQTLRKGERFGTVEAVKTVEEIYAPLSGEVVEVNESLEADAEQVNKEPYGAGWMIRIRCSDQDELAEPPQPPGLRRVDFRSLTLPVGLSPPSRCRTGSKPPGFHPPAAFFTIASL